jgi:hypothetical protein
MNPNPSDPRSDNQPEHGENKPVRRAGLPQVAKTLLFGLFAIGMKGTWNKDGVKVTPGQIVVGAIVGGIVLVAALITLVNIALKLATGPGHG